jgi:hypothetical protein
VVAWWLVALGVCTEDTDHWRSSDSSRAREVHNNVAKAFYLQSDAGRASGGF